MRAIVYATPEFDERMDGIVYGTVAGLGVATLLNLRYMIDNDGVALAPGVIQVVDDRAGAGVVRRPDGLFHGRGQVRAHGRSGGCRSA